MPGILISTTPVAGTCTGTGYAAPPESEGLDFSSETNSMYLCLF